MQFQRLIETAKRTDGDRQGYSRPIDCVPTLTPKAVLETTALYLSRRGITELHGFTIFKNLETLYIEGNELTSLSGLDTNMGLEQLYAGENATKFYAMFHRHRLLASGEYMCVRVAPQATTQPFCACPALARAHVQRLHIQRLHFQRLYVQRLYGQRLHV